MSDASMQCQDKFIKATGTASVLFDLLTEVSSSGDVESLAKGTLTDAGITGYDAIQEAKDAFEQMLDLYNEAVKAQEVQS